MKPSPNQIVLEGKGIPGESYLIETTGNLITPFDQLGNTTVTDPNSQWQYLDTLPNGTLKRFYHASRP